MIDIGNTFALLALLGWPVVVVVMFRTLTPERALIWSILGGYMLLPQLSEINLPGVPALDKESIPNLSAFACSLAALGRMPNLIPESRIARVLLGLFIVSPAFTVLTNLEPIHFGVDQFGSFRLLDANALDSPGLPGLRIYDSASALVGQMFLMLPFFLAREMLRTEEALREILLALVIAGAIYALPMLWEVRFSPQLHTKLYGFFQHDFRQAMRGGGFRPFVFMPHGLWVAFFAFMVAMAAAARARIADKPQVGARLIVVVMTLGLVAICRSMGPMSYALIFVPAVLLLKPRMQLLIASVIAVAVIAYPLLRGGGLIPTEAILERVAAISDDRAQSLGYRFDNEEMILGHAADKPLFGWGGWGRFMVYDPATGQTWTVVDGLWILTIGEYGWLGYIALFGLLALPVLATTWEARREGAAPVTVTVTTLVLILAVNILDMVPNATLIPFTWLIVGALLGHAEAMKRATDIARTERLRRAHGAIVLGVDRPTVTPRESAPTRPRTLL